LFVSGLVNYQVQPKVSPKAALHETPNGIPISPVEEVLAGLLGVLAVSRVQVTFELEKFVGESLEIILSVRVSRVNEFRKIDDLFLCFFTHFKYVF
jgi:hypothetical protein